MECSADEAAIVNLLLKPKGASEGSERAKVRNNYFNYTQKAYGIGEPLGKSS